MTIGASAGIGRSWGRCATGITKRNAKSRTAGASATCLPESPARAETMITVARATVKVARAITKGKATEKTATRGTIMTTKAAERAATKEMTMAERATARIATAAIMAVEKAAARAKGKEAA